MKIVLWILRIIVGVLFIFSGLVKANDPLGLSYKTQEFFEKMGLDFLHDHTLWLSVVMIILEVVAGVAVIIGHKLKTYGILLLGLVLFFTYLTAFALFVKTPEGEPIIKECGCFGDCIKMSNWETFIKDLVLLAFIIIIFALRKYIKPVFSAAKGRMIIIATVIVTLGLQLLVLRNLPIVDCLPYKVGNYLPSLMTVPEEDKEIIESKYIYKKDGKEQEFNLDNLPDDTWEFVDRKDVVIQEAKSEAKVKDFVLSDINGNDITSFALESPEPFHLWMVKDVNSYKSRGLESAKKMYERAVMNNEYMILVTANAPEDMLEFKQKFGLPSDMEMCSLDGTTFKTVLRNKEGIMTLQDGTVTEKYAWPDFKKHAK